MVWSGKCLEPASSTGLMLIKWLLFLLALIAHSWLWGQWSLETTLKTSMMLGASTLLLAVMGIMPIRSLLKKKNPKDLFSTYWMQGIFYAYLFLIILMSVFSFTGWIQILLPIKVLLLASYAGLRFYLKKKTKKDSWSTLQWSRVSLFTKSLGHKIVPVWKRFEEEKNLWKTLSKAISYFMDLKK